MSGFIGGQIIFVLQYSSQIFKRVANLYDFKIDNLLYVPDDREFPM